MNSAASVLGILAGGGGAPKQLVAACQRMGRAFFVIALDGQADPDLVAGDIPHAWLPLGGLAQLKKIAVEQNLHALVMLGRVRRPSLTELKPDWLALKALTKIGLNSFGDDALLRNISRVLEEETGLRILGAHEIFADMLTPRGVLGAVTPDAQAENDIRRGLEVVRTLGAADVGQAAVIQQGLVLAVEAIEGTDAMITRAALLKREGVGGVLVKLAKPQQDHRFDLPTIGTDTVKACQAAGLRGIAVEAERSLCLDRAAVIRAAEAAGIFIIGVSGAVE